MMNIKFTAKVIHITSEDCFQVIFADDKIEPANYLILQRAFEIDEQDKALGMINEYIELNEQTVCGYNLCDSAVFAPALFFSTIGDFGKINIDFDEDACDMKELEKQMQQIFRDKLNVGSENMKNNIETILNELSEQDRNTIKNLPLHLYDILCDELHAGNVICEISQWTPESSQWFILLEKPFMTPIRPNIQGVLAYRDINDPHYWKAEYQDMSIAKGDVLVCKFARIRDNYNAN